MIKKIFNYSLKILSILVFVLTLYIMVFGTIALSNNRLVNIFGYSYGFVPTDSMEGTAPAGSKIDSFNKGSVVIIKFDDFNDLENNDVIVYKSKDNYLKVHRIIETNQDYYLTKGDNPSASPDLDDLVTIDKYEGRVIKVFGAFGLGMYLSEFRSIIFMILTLVLFIYLIWQIKEIVKTKYVKEELSEDELDKLVEERLKAIKERDNYEK